MRVAIVAQVSLSLPRSGPGWVVDPIGVSQGLDLEWLQAGNGLLARATESTKCRLRPATASEGDGIQLELRLAQTQNGAQASLLKERRSLDRQ